METNGKAENSLNTGMESHTASGPQCGCPAQWGTNQDPNGGPGWSRLTRASSVEGRGLRTFTGVG